MRMETTIDQKTIQTALETYLARNVGGDSQSTLELTAGRGDKGFTATLSYGEGVIIQAIKNHVGQMFNADFRMEVELAATRGPQGITAVIVITDEAAELAVEAAVTDTDTSAPFEVDTTPEAPKADDAASTEEAPARTGGLFAHLKKPDNSVPADED